MINYFLGLKVWKQGGGGVSAFGFSGTNCHLVLEEAPESISFIETIKSKMNVFTISCRNKAGLQQLIDQYYCYLIKDKTTNFQDICYTANTGRGHYQYRILVIAEHLTELLEKLVRLQNADLENLNENGVYYGEHQIVSPLKEFIEKNELTEKQKRKLTVRADQLLAKYLADNEKSTLEALCL
ncbi:CurL C-terminal domain-containing protein, partial [Lacrimispora brassicae]